MRSLAGLLVVALISVLAYKLYFSKMQSSETGTPMQTISAVGVKNDLLAIAQAERAYQAEHGSYGSLEELKVGRCDVDAEGWPRRIFLRSGNFGVWFSGDGKMHACHESGLLELDG